MTVPSTSVPGSLGAFTNLANGGASFEFQDFLPPRGCTRVTFYLRVTAGVVPWTFAITRSSTGGFVRTIPAITPAATPSEETIVVLDYAQSMGRLRPTITNNSAGNITGSLEVAYELPTRR
jgi:hypothetical protein